MTDTNTYCYYTVEIPFNEINSSTWIEYRGEHIGYDWWNTSPMRFNSEEDAVKAISESDDYKNCNWRIVKTIVTRTVAHEFKNS